MKAVLIVASLFISTVGAQAETLGQALVAAYKHNGLLAQNRALLRAADEDVAAATAALRPVINYSLSSNYSSINQDLSTNFGITASLMLFDSGSTKLRRELAQQNVMSTREALRGIEQNVLLQAVNAYMAVRRDSALLQLRQSNVGVIEQELQASEDRFEVGEITRTEVAFAQAQLAGAKSALAVAKGNLDRSREQYRAAIGQYPGRLQAPPVNPTSVKSLDEARAIARLKHPDMAQAQRSVIVSDLNVELAQLAIRPTLRGNAGLTVLEGGQDSGNVSLTLSGPIYSGGKLASDIRKANARRDASRAGLHLTRHTIEQNVGIAWSQVAVADAGLAATEEQIRASRVAFRGVKEEANLGSRTTLDVLNAEQDLLDAESSRLSAQTDQQIAAYNLMAAMGMLTAQDLNLNVARYDPAAYYNAVKAAPTYKVSPQGKKLDHVLKAIGKK